MKLPNGETERFTSSDRLIEASALFTARFQVVIADTNYSTVT